MLHLLGVQPKWGNQFVCEFHVGYVLLTKVGACIFTSEVLGTCLC